MIIIKCDWCGSKGRCFAWCECSKCIDPEEYNAWKFGNPEEYKNWIEDKKRRFI